MLDADQSAQLNERSQPYDKNQTWIRSSRLCSAALQAELRRARWPSPAAGIFIELPSTCVTLDNVLLVGSNRVSGLGPQLFPDWEDSTAVGPDVLMSTAPGEPTVRTY